MELSKQVCSLESAKKLDALQLNTNTAFFYVNDRLCIEADNSDCHNSDDVAKYFCLEDGKIYQYTDTDEIVNTYTSSELGEMLPDEYCESGKVECSYPDMFYCGTDNLDYFVHSKTEAEARAKMLIYLLENKLITAEQINGATK